MNYYAIVTKLVGVRKHPNADRLNLAICFGNQVVVGLDAQDGDIGIYFPCDGQLSEEYCKANNLIGYVDPITNERKGGFFAKNRRVRAQKFRGEKSDGYFTTLDSLSFTNDNIKKYKEGDQITEVNGIEICRKYISPKTFSSGNKSQKRVKKKDYPMFHEHVDTEQFAYNYNKGAIKNNDILYMSEKMHGTSSRISNTKEIKLLKKWQEKLNKIYPFFKQKSEWKYISGTRRIVLGDLVEDVKTGFYGTDAFRKIHHDKLVGKLYKGETVYCEIVGWVNNELPIMNRCNNEKLKDKEFVKRYDKETIFKYGCSQGTSEMYVYRITISNEDGIEFDYSWQAIKKRCVELGIKHVPELESTPFIFKDFSGAYEQLYKKIDKLAEGESTIDPSHIREGVVIRIERDSTFRALKHKNFQFKVLEDIIKESDVIDIEEAQEFT